jgi:hypothetical protein
MTDNPRRSLLSAARSSSRSRHSPRVRLQARRTRRFGLRNCTMQHGSARPRCLWNPDVDSPIDYKVGWITQPTNDTFHNAFKVQWEIFLVIS